MILLLGGTGETREIAQALASPAVKVMVSTATDNALDVGSHPNISRRIGRLTEEEMVSLIREQGVALLVDATHPFAVVAHETAQNAARAAGVPCLRYERPATEYGHGSIIYVSDHAEAADAAFSFGMPVLLTTGSRNLQPYVEQSERSGIPVIARVLPHAESLDACRNAGLADDAVIAGRGPFSIDENLEAIRNFNIGVIVTKDSGSSGGVPEKLEAARIAGCRMVMIRRPDSGGAPTFSAIPRLVDEIRRRIS